MIRIMSRTPQELEEHNQTATSAPSLTKPRISPQNLLCIGANSYALGYANRTLTENLLNYADVPV